MFKKQRFKRNFKKILDKHLTQQIFGELSDMTAVFKVIQDQDHWYFTYEDGVFTVMTNKAFIKFETYKPVFEKAIAEIDATLLKIYQINKSVAVCPSYRVVALFELNLG